MRPELRVGCVAGLCAAVLLCARPVAALDIGPESFLRAAGGPPWRIVAAHVEQPPKIDGALDDPGWDRARRVGPFRIANTTRLCKEQMLAFVLYSDDALFFGFAAEDADVTGGPSARDSDDVWQTDCAEIFLSPARGRTAAEWFQFIVNSAGARYDGSLDAKVGAKWDPKPDWEASGRRRPWGWTAEVRIPFASLGVAPPARGDLWAVRLARENYARKAATELSSWTPSGYGFDDLLSVGELVFGELDPAKLAAAYQIREGLFCLTANAPPGLEALNRDIGGRYTYCEAGVDAPHFPYYVPFEDRSPAEGMRVGGWLSFAEGILTDGDLGPAAGWPVFQIGSNGFDMVFDLGAEYAIDRVELLAGPPVIRNATLSLKSPGGRYVMVRALHDQVEFDTKGFGTHALADFGGLNCSARWLRANAAFSGAPYPGLSEVRIWGRPLKAGEVLPKTPIRQNGGQVVVETPEEVRLPEPPQPPIFPAPQEVRQMEGLFRFTPATAIALPADATPRARATAETLREELHLCFGIAVAVTEQPGEGCIRLEEGPGAPERAEGYELVAQAGSIRITGRDPAGVFHGGMSLLQCVEWRDGGWAVPAVTVRDWPEKPVRYIVANRRLTPPLVRALARLKINYFDNGIGNVTTDSARNFDRYARGIAPMADRYFIKLTPGVQFNWAWMPDPERFVERAPGEPLEKLGHGRRNPCPSDPEMWKRFLEILDIAASSCNSDFVNLNLDEMQQPANGSRWNVCDRCRARNLAGHELWAETLRRLDAHLAAQGRRALLNDSPFWKPGISNPQDKINDWRLAAEALAREGRAKRFTVYVWHPKEVTERLSKLGFPLLRWRDRVPSAEDAQGPYDGYYMNLADGPFDLAVAAGAAQMAWSPGRLASGTEEFDAAVERMQPAVRELVDGLALPSWRPGPKEFFSVDLRAAANLSRFDEDPCDGKGGWVDLGSEMDLRALAPGRRSFAGVPFEIIDEGRNGGRSCVLAQNPALPDRTHPQRVEFPVDRTAASLLFLHTLTERPGQNYVRKAELAGYYLIVYDDGLFAKEEIKYNITAANWDGLPTSWGYSPKGKTMKRATLAWQGRTRAGVTAALYYAEWVNPRPDRKIARVVLSAPHLPRAASPILLAVTGVAPTPADKPFGGDLRPLSLLTPGRPVGRPMDLAGGRALSAERYVAPDGTVLSAPGIENKADVAGCDPFWSCAASVLYGGLHGVRSATGHQPLLFTFPEPRALTGVEVTPAFREEASTSDFRGLPRAYAIELSPDGFSWRELPRQTMHEADLEGPRFIAFPEGAWRAVRLTGAFSRLRFYE
jgi:hypothetical protein